MLEKCSSYRRKEKNTYQFLLFIYLDFSVLINICNFLQTNFLIFFFALFQPCIFWLSLNSAECCRILFQDSMHPSRTHEMSCFLGLFLYIFLGVSSSNLYLDYSLNVLHANTSIESQIYCLLINTKHMLLILILCFLIAPPKHSMGGTQITIVLHTTDSPYL